MKRAWLLALGCLLGCSSQKVPKNAFVGAPSCGQLGALVDLHHAMRGATSPHDATGVRLLARIEEELGYVDAVRGEGRVSLTRLREQLERRRQAVDLALNSAAETRTALDERLARTKNERVSAALRGVDLRDAAALKRGAAHLEAMSFEDTDAPARLVEDLEAHAASLQVLAELSAPFVDATLSPDPIRLRVEKDVESLRLECLDAIDTTHRIVARGGAPRAATVVVEPSLPETVERVAGENRRFGSGFVVHWRGADGGQRLRIITNHHVMGGAREAEVRLSTQLDDDAKPARARLLRSDPVDDLAILEVTDGREQVVDAGLALRSGAPAEREAVVAAGFPGVGRDPSYQVSEGVVSNARFGARKDDATGVGAYIQHTAAIDPGNSGGPLLDASGAVVGVNTLKLHGRENVGLAIPTPRVELALLRADETPRFGHWHARASCHLAVAALGALEPSYAELDRFGVALYDGREDRAGTTEAAAIRAHVGGRPENAVARLRAYAFSALRAELDEVGGVQPFARCQNLQREADAFTATIAARRGPSWKLTLAPSRGRLRVVRVERQGNEP